MSALEDHPYRMNYYRFVGSYQSVSPDSELVQMFETRLSRTVTDHDLLEINISDQDFYSVFKVVDAHNAPLLIEHGLPDGNAVVDFLHEHQLPHLIRDNRKAVAKAKRRRIPPGVFFDISTAAYRSHCSHDEVMSAIDLWAECRSLPYVRKHLVPLVIEKSVQYSDAKKLGFKVLEANPNQALILDALKSIRIDPDITVEHIRSILITWEGDDLDHQTDRYAPITESRNMTEKYRLKFLKLLGGDAAISLRNPVYLTRSIHADWVEVLSRKGLIRFYAYADALRTATDQKSDPSMETLTLMMDAGVSVELLAEGFIKGWGNDRIIALSEGIAPPLTDGWL